jgi:hypothetical protein
VLTKENNNDIILNIKRKRNRENE